MRKKSLKMIAMIMASVLCFTACGSTASVETSEETTVNEEASEEVVEAETETEEVAAVDSHADVVLLLYMAGMDPAVNWCGWNLTRCGIGETLVTVNENMEIVGQLADSWEQIDELTYSFHLRQGVEFSNGTIVTPEIVKESIERSVATNSRGENLKLESIEIDGENLIFTTKEPFSAFVANMTEPMFCIVDTTADMSGYETMPICTGPYYITDYIPEENIELAAHEGYWDGVAEIKTITVKNIGSDTKVDAMLAGDLDVAQGASLTTLARLEGNTDGIEIITALGTRENDMTLNCSETSPLHDVTLRQALSYAVDRDIIAQIVGNGYSSPLTTAFPASVGYDSDKVIAQAYDIEKTKALLEEGGYVDEDGDGFVENNGEPMVLTLTSSSSGNTAMAEALQNMWKAVGINTEIEMLENVADKRASGEFDVLTSAGWQTVNAGDGQKYLMERWHSEGTDNHSRYASEEYDAALAKLDAAFDTESRISAFVEAQQILADDAPAIWMCANDNVTLVNTQTVENVTVFPIDYYLITNKWTLAKYK